MASENARLAKEKGNAAFKAADYPSAIGHYTAAIFADGSDPTFFLNRAAAYLKLGKNEDAERDCTKVLALSAKNVKALFRRGQARRALEKLDDARFDLDSALALEPANSSVKEELLEVDKLLREKQLKQRKTTIDPRPQVASPRSPSVATPPRRRRVPIEIVEANADAQQDPPKTTSAETKDEALLQPISSRVLKPEAKPSTAETTPSSKPQTFTDAKQARESSKPTRVGGGIFRPSGNHTIVTRTLVESASPHASTPAQASSKPNSAPPTKPPTSLFQFTKSWDSLTSDDDRWKLIRTIPPSSIPALFQASLEPDLLKSILHTFRTTLDRSSDPDASDVVGDYLSAFTRVQRFGTVMLFMDKQEKQLLELLRDKVKHTP